MRQPTRRTIAHLLVLPVLVTAVGLGGCLGQPDERTVTVLASWTGAEEESFRRVLDRFEDEYGIEVDYQGSRAVRQILLAEVQKGTPPDVAVLPTLSEMAAYHRRDVLRPLGGEPESSMSRQWREWAQLDDGGELDVVPIKADLKSLVWYVPGRVPFGPADEPQSWEALVETSRALASTGATPWCLGMSATPGSGWPGTDWIEDILLHRSGRAAYDRWSSGGLAWTSPEMTAAWTAWGDLVNASGMVRGGAAAALLTEFTDAGRPMFTDQPGCRFEHQASFVVGIRDGYPDDDRGAAVRAADVARADYFPFPTFGGPEADGASRQGSVVSADFAGLFTDKTAAKDLIRFLATDEAQAIWQGSSAGTFFSVNREVGPDRPTAPAGDDRRAEVKWEIAETLTAGTSPLCLDASDVMPTAMANAFQHAVLEYLQYPDRLDALLGTLERLRASIGAEEWLPRGTCSESGQ
ncbi:ABC transporter substrate-binding protein [Plantactinospora endophytica]|uniref:ABC transporter substrate-binding protein n=1 Tax=Plantactinospora endophytica TaxID=673535 RepID=A0ABQ4DW01_9ACTN|nr:extracellular solute-binding protein [Plantactinospora endophytica]GIG86633.1 ABC transporter substrate-binding protein [Plantactinospora endophytica]